MYLVLSLWYYHFVYFFVLCSSNGGYQAVSSLAKMCSEFAPLKQGSEMLMSLEFYFRMAFNHFIRIYLESKTSFYIAMKSTKTSTIV